MNDKYFLFGYDDYYPRGGMNDYLGKFDTAEQAKEYALNVKNKWVAKGDDNIQFENFQIVDGQMVIIEIGTLNYANNFVEWKGC